ncbi:MAG: hypothetical protein QOH31_4363 [Verrucomicrobiota bacterium]|jgi:hypothetical protein
MAQFHLLTRIPAHGQSRAQRVLKRTFSADDDYLALQARLS